MLDYTKIVNLLKAKKYNDSIDYLYSNIELIKEQYSQEHQINIFESYDIKKLTDKDINKTNKALLLRDIILLITINKSESQFDEKNEIAQNRTKIKYVLNIANKEIIKKLFFLYLITYNFEVINQDDIYYVGVDYEFSKRIIALMQINFETPSLKTKTTYSYLWIINPGLFTKDQIEILIKNLMIEQKIIKILHGCDSLDYPYMIDEMFSNNKEYAKQFTHSFIDTRYLCELYKSMLNDTQKKCAIYDALLFFNTISQNKYDFLENSHDNMGPVQDIEWNINKMSSFHILYALYDVLFLKHYLFDIFRMSFEKLNNDNIYKYLLFIVRFVLLEKKEVTLITKISKAEIDPINNYLIKFNNKNFTLIAIYNDIIKKFIIQETDIDVNLLLEINYIKTNLVILLKRIIYGIITENFKVKKNKNEIFTTKLLNTELYEQLNKENYTKIVKFLKMFEKTAFVQIMRKYKN